MMLILDVKLYILKVEISFPCPLSLPFYRLSLFSKLYFNPSIFPFISQITFTVYAGNLSFFLYSLSLLSYSMGIKSTFYCPVCLINLLINQYSFSIFFMSLMLKTLSVIRDIIKKRHNPCTQEMFIFSNYINIFEIFFRKLKVQNYFFSEFL